MRSLSFTHRRDKPYGFEDFVIAGSDLRNVVFTRGEYYHGFPAGELVTSHLYRIGSSPTNAAAIHPQSFSRKVFASFRHAHYVVKTHRSDRLFSHGVVSRDQKDPHELRYSVFADELTLTGVIDGLCDVGQFNTALPYTYALGSSHLLAREQSSVKDVDVKRLLY